MRRLLQRWLLAGVVIWLPIVATILAVRFLVDLLDQTIAWMPAAWQPERWLGFELPGLGLLFSLIIVLATGALAANWVGLKLLGVGESVVDRLPLIRSIYKSMKRVAETVFSDKGNAFREVLMLEYPRKGL